MTEDSELFPKKTRGRYFFPLTKKDEQEIKMKNYKRIANKICKMERFIDVHNCGYPTSHFPVNLYFQTYHGYKFYVAYDWGKWSIDYTLDKSISMRTDMKHIHGIKTDRDMYKKVREIIDMIKECSNEKDRLYLKLSKEQKEELENHLRMNGYDVTWITEDIIDVNPEETSYILSILSDRDIKSEDTTIEWCPHCNLEVEISAERAVPCPNCGKMMCPCSACPRTCDCCDCPY